MFKLFQILWIPQCPYFWNSHSLLSKGQTWRVFNHLEIQWKWKAWLQTPQATVHSSLVAEAWLAWHSMHKSIMWFLQIAQLSTTMSHAQRATAFHFFTSKRFFSPFEVLDDGCSSSFGSTSISETDAMLKELRIALFFKRWFKMRLRMRYKNISNTSVWKIMEGWRHPL